MRKILFFVICFSGLVNSVFAKDNNDTGSHLKTKFYANIYLDMFYIYQDATSAHDEIDVGSFDISPSHYSNFGVRVSYQYFYGDIELGLNPNEPIRKMFITYNFTDNSALTIGRDTTIASYTFGQVSGEENGLMGFGAVGDIRSFMLKYNYDNFEIALIHTGSDREINFSTINSGIVPTDTDNMTRVKRDQFLPRVELAYFIGDDNYEVKLFASLGYYSSLTIKPDGKKKRYNVLAGLIGAGGEIDIGRLAINYSAFFGANNTLFNSLSKDTLVPRYNNRTARADDVYSIGIAMGLGYIFNNHVKLQVGGGYMSSLSDSFVDKNGKKVVDQDFAIYMNLPITITRSFAILPEVSYLDNIRDGFGNKEGLTIYAGVHFIAKF